jgi:hypothetical protein
VKKLFGIIALAIVGALAFTGCGNQFKTNYYRPTAFGENSQCYYVNDPAEAIMLQQQGFCDTNWRPVMAPTYWTARYAPYYSSAEYRDYYVPANKRGFYKVYFVDFERTNSTLIKSEQSKAQYKDNKGKVVDGNTVPRGQFGGGVRSKGGQGIRGDNGKSMKKNHDNIVKKAEKEEKKRQENVRKQQEKTTSGSSGSNKKTSTGGGIRNGGSNKSYTPSSGRRR